jgi:peptidoglycan/xylan/chitin deacetylase (PgdA/CDA1 family)
VLKRTTVAAEGQKGGNREGDRQMQRFGLRTIVVAGMSGVVCLGVPIAGQQPSSTSAGDATKPFHWRNENRAAVSLSFDDARASQVDVGLALLKRADVKVTFYITPGAAEKRLDGWKQAVADGHEIANHSLTHPCTGNYAFSQHNALENYDLRTMAQQLDTASERILKVLGVRPTTFAYPCGLKFVGRGLDVRSYVPLVAERFLVGRGYLDESPNDPAVTDLSQAMGTPFDDMDFPRMKDIVESAAKEGRWVIFVGHDIGERRYQTTDAKALQMLCEYLKDPTNHVWLGTVAEIGAYVRDQRATAQ